MSVLDNLRGFVQLINGSTSQIARNAAENNLLQFQNDEHFWLHVIDLLLCADDSLLFYIGN